MGQVEIKEELTKIAFKKSRAYCYHCYVYAQQDASGSEMCPRCLSDDLMRVLSDDGPEWGVVWIIDRLLEENCQRISEMELSERFQEMLDECYPSIQICGTEWNQGEAFKKLDPVAFDLALSEYIASEDGETLISFNNGSTYFLKESVESFISENQ